MSAFDCIEEIRRAGGGRLTTDQIEEILEDVQRRAARRSRGVDSHADALLAAAREAADEIKMAAVIERRNRAINIAARKRVDAYVARWQDPLDGVSALNVGRNTPVRGARLSVDARQKALHAKFVGSMIADLQRDGLLEFVTRSAGGPMARWIGVGPGPLDREIAMELWEIGRDGGRPGISGSDEARKIAAIIHKHQEAARVMQNRAGAWIRKMPGYVVSQSHDMTRMRAAGFAEWSREILPRLDEERTFGGADPMEFLRGAYDGLASGVHYKPRTGDDWLGGFKGPANLGKTLSAERVLHFRSAGDWYAYNQRFGSTSLMEAVTNGLGRAADAVGLMEVWGTNPRAMFDAVIDGIRRKHRGNLGLMDALRGLRGQMVEAQFREVDGTTRIPGSVSLARWSAGIRAVESMAKLGGAVVSSITDVGVLAGEVRRQGQGLLDGYKLALDNLVQGRGEGERRQVADLVGVGMEATVGDVMSRFSANDHAPGTLAKGLRLFFRLNLLNWWTDSHKTGVGFMMARELGMKAERSWDQLDEPGRKMLGLYEIGEREWDAIRATAWDGEEGRKFVTPERVQGLPDDVVDGLGSGAAEVVAGYQVRIERLVKRYAELGRKFDRIGALVDKAEAIEIKATVEAYRRQAEATARLREQLVGYRDGGRSFGQAHRTLIREIEHLAKAEQRIAGDASRRIDRLQRQAAKLARATDVEAAANAVRADLSALADELAALPERLERDLANARARTRDGLETRLRAYFTDRVDHAVLTPGARENAIMRLGTEPGTPFGEAARFIMQFKAFPITFLTKGLGPAVYGGGARTLTEALIRGKGDMQGLAHLMAASFVLGFVALAAHDMRKGRTPRDPRDPSTWVAAFLQGGGAGIYGDFLFGEVNRFGGGALATAMGPAFGSGEDLFRLYGKVRAGDDPSAQTFRFLVNHTPFMNLFYTRVALDYLILHDVTEALNPGALRRLERRIERENAQKFMLKPSRDRARPFTD